MTLRTLNYGNYGIFLIMGNAGFCPSTVVWGFLTITEQPQDGSLTKRTLLCAPTQLVSKTSKGPPEPEKNSEDSHTQQCSTDGFFTPSMRAASFLASCPWHTSRLVQEKLKSLCHVHAEERALAFP